MHKTASDDPTTVIGSDVRWRKENLQVHSIVGSSRTRLPPPDRAKWHVNMHYAFIRFRLHNRLKETMAFVSHCHKGPAHTTTLTRSLPRPTRACNGGRKKTSFLRSDELGGIRCKTFLPSFLPASRSITFVVSSLPPTGKCQQSSSGVFGDGSGDSSPEANGPRGGRGSLEGAKQGAPMRTVHRNSTPRT